MTVKEMFKKIENYNEVADLMRTNKEKIELSYEKYFAESFTNYQEFRKYVKREFINPIPEKILNDTDFNFDETRHFVLTDLFGYTFDFTIEISIVAM